jgi:hypothetical protein
MARTVHASHENDNPARNGKKKRQANGKNNYRILNVYFHAAKIYEMRVIPKRKTVKSSNVRFDHADLYDPDILTKTFSIDLPPLE